MNKNDYADEMAEIKKRLDKLEGKQNDAEQETAISYNFREDLSAEDLELTIQCLEEKIEDLIEKRKHADEHFVMLYNIDQEIQKWQKLLQKFKDEQDCRKDHSEAIDRLMKKLLDVKEGK